MISACTGTPDNLFFQIIAANIEKLSIKSMEKQKKPNYNGL
jgi:hypothetical protein